jgi:hypothetical protein
MGKAKVKLNFIEFDVPVKIQFCTDRNDNMMDDTFFNDPDVPYATITSNIGDVQTANLAFLDGGHGTSEALKDAVEILDNNMRLQCDFVNRKTNGNITRITSIGFEYTSTERTAAQVPVKVAGLSLDRGKTAGSVKITHDAIADAKFYTAIVSTEANLEVTVIGNQVKINNTQPVIILSNTKTDKTITNLESGTRVYVFVWATNSAGKGPDSSKENIIVP